MHINEKKLLFRMRKLQILRFYDFFFFYKITFINIKTLNLTVYIKALASSIHNINTVTNNWRLIPQCLKSNLSQVTQSTSVYGLLPRSLSFPKDVPIVLHVKMQEFGLVLILNCFLVFLTRLFFAFVVFFSVLLLKKNYKIFGYEMKCVNPEH